jgi:hypothetical protein
MNTGKWKILLTVLTLTAVLPAAEEAGKETVLKSTLAGQWYPADADTLKKQIEGFFQKAEVKPKSDVIALILPHAGYQYSGQTAVYGIQAAERQYKRIVVIGPTHRLPMVDVLSVPDAVYYETPLGRIPFDTEFAQKLLKNPVFQNIPQAYRYEHSVQIEVPLLQAKWKDFKLVLIVAGDCSPQTIDKAAAVLRNLVDEDTLVVASSDFVHYGPNYDYVPFTENIPEQIRKLDMGAYERIAALDAKGFLEYRQKTGATICGYIPIAILLSMLDKSAKAELIKYTTSGELTGDFTNSVSYLSVAFSGSRQKKEKQENKEISMEKQENKQGYMGLSEAEKKELLKLARSALVYYLEKGKTPVASDLDVSIGPAMKKNGAAFVTLKEHSELRGCIGDIIAQGPLYESVIRNAINAGVNDWRFMQVTKAECDDIEFEISALTEPKLISSYKQIRIGIDGVILRKRGASAVFLPQVAPEQGWNVEEMLTHLSLKAGLPADAWKDGAEFFVFQADVFGEEK